MKASKIKRARRDRRKRGIRKRIRGTTERPRLTVSRSLNHIYAQIVDDLTGTTLAASSTLDKDQKISPGDNCQAATAVGRKLAERAKKAGIETVVFDRGGRKYHGRIKALAVAAREGGLRF